MPMYEINMPRKSHNLESSSLSDTSPAASSGQPHTDDERHRPRPTPPPPPPRRDEFCKKFPPKANQPAQHRPPAGTNSL